MTKITLKNYLIENNIFDQFLTDGGSPDAKVIITNRSEWEKSALRASGNANFWLSHHTAFEYIANVESTYDYIVLMESEITELGNVAVNIVKVQDANIVYEGDDLTVYVKCDSVRVGKIMATETIGWLSQFSQAGKIQVVREVKVTQKITDVKKYYPVDKINYLLLERGVMYIGVENGFGIFKGQCDNKEIIVKVEKSKLIETHMSSYIGLGCLLHEDKISEVVWGSELLDNNLQVIK